PPSQWNPQLPPELDGIIAKALEKDRSFRYQHASEMRADLQRLKRDTETGRVAASSGTVAAQAPSGRQGKLGKGVVPLLTAVLLVAGGLFFFFRFNKRLSEKENNVLTGFSNQVEGVGFVGTSDTAAHDRPCDVSFL